MAGGLVGNDVILMNLKGICDWDKEEKRWGFGSGGAILLGEEKAMFGWFVKIKQI